MDDFLNEYSRAWQQEGMAMEQQLSDIGLDKLHDNIAQHQRRARRRTLWLSVSSAACLALVVGLGYRLMMPSEVPMPAVAHNSPSVSTPVPEAAHPNSTTPGTTNATLQGKNSAFSTPSALRSAEVGIAPSDSLSSATPLPLPEATPFNTIHNQEPLLAQTEQPHEPSVRIVETHSLVATQPNTSTTHIAQTTQLVKIVEPQRKTFREAIVEPLLALAGNNQNN